MRQTFRYPTLLLGVSLSLVPSAYAQFGGGAAGGGGGSAGGGFRGGSGSGGEATGPIVGPSTSSGAPGEKQMPSPGTGGPTTPGVGNPCGVTSHCGTGTGSGGNTGGIPVGVGRKPPSARSQAKEEFKASVPTESKLRVTNKCSKSIRVAIEYRDASRKWITGGWWAFEPAESAFVLHNGRTVQSNNSIFYFYATGDGIAWKGESPGTVDGKAYMFREITLPVEADDTFELALTCPGR